MTDREGSSNGAGAKASALIIAGAAGKGPYAAGALSELARDPRFDVRHLAGASSGALNAAVYAAGLRASKAEDAAQHLCELWRTKANWHRIISHKQRVKIVSDALERYRELPPGASERKVKLDLVVASLRGVHDARQRLRFEQPFTFDTASFGTREGIAEIAERCIQSATIPVMFPPRTYKDEGQFWDGGIVNNTPIGKVLKGDASIDHVLVITPDSFRKEDASVRHGRFAIWRLLEMVIEERLARDLEEAESFNEELVKLYRAGVDPRKLDPSIHWRLLQFVEIRPPQDPEGSLISGFLSGERRSQYVQCGIDTARAILARWQPRPFLAAPRPAPAPAPLLS